MRTFQEFMIIVEGMTMKDFKKQRSRQKQKEKRADDKIAPGRRAGIHNPSASPERASRHRANVDPDFEGNDERNYPGGKLRSKKVRKAKALGELGESHYRFESLDDRRDEIDARRKEAIEKQKEKLEDREDRNQLKKEIKSEIKQELSKQELSSEAYDAEVMGRSQIRKTGEGGRIGAERKKSTPERRRMKAVGGGKMEPVEYKDRKDIGSQRQTSTRIQQPEKERGSAEVTQTYAQKAKEERRKAAQARIAAKKGGGEKPTTEKPKAKEVSQQASKLLSKKKEEKPVSPDYTPPKASGMTRAERMSQQRKGEAMLKDIMKDQEFSRYEKETGQKATGKAKTKLLGRVAQRMAN